MAHGAPDYTTQVQVKIVSAQPGEESAAGDFDTYSGGDTTYQTVASWTVTAGKIGELKEILILSDDYAHTEIQITIAGDVKCTDWSPQAAMPIIYEDLRLAAGAVVLVEAQSTDGTSITVDAIIVGKEVG